ncbi:MAG: tetraacyldisaccharide 4'-kinase [Bacteroidetes bacterium MedPE-SWsnd-G2]|nr:MAG: tetraacyldisaccharide 4'-kinase [Bacteroidetes bacterium MedPE-SWsnd-G2]
MNLLRKLLFPIVPVYYFVTWMRNYFYDKGIYKSKSYNVPIIAVGNLSVGGTGKTPLIELLIRTFKDDYKLATLSRGYKRKTSGFVLAGEADTALTLGDEPFQFHSKFQDIKVSVDANRQEGIELLMQQPDAPNLILLDDAYQHRKVTAGYYVLLSSYEKLYTRDMLLPTGDLREPISGAKRAKSIVITKCPPSLTLKDKQKIISELKPQPEQNVFFSWISYSDVIKNNQSEKNLMDLKSTNFKLVTGIANPKPLLEFLNLKGLKFEHLEFNDHHDFSEKEIEQLKTLDCILTTEKDYVRLSPHFKNSDQLFYLPISFEIDRLNDFKSDLKSYIDSAKQS